MDLAPPGINVQSISMPRLAQGRKGIGINERVKSEMWSCGRNRNWARGHGPSKQRPMSLVKEVGSWGWKVRVERKLHWRAQEALLSFLSLIVRKCTKKILMPF